jgi:hypothetical protein
LPKCLKCKVSAGIGPGDSPAQLLHVFAICCRSWNSESGNEYVSNIFRNLGNPVFIFVCVFNGWGRVFRVRFPEGRSPLSLRSGPSSPNSSVANRIGEGSALQMLAARQAHNEESPASPCPYRLRGRPLRSGSAPATRKAPQEYLRGSSPPNARSK